MRTMGYALSVWFGSARIHASIVNEVGSRSAGASATVAYASAPPTLPHWRAWFGNGEVGEDEAMVATSSMGIEKRASIGCLLWPVTGTTGREKDGGGAIPKSFRRSCFFLPSCPFFGLPWRNTR